MSNILEILVGPIASGKSTYTKDRVNARYLVVNDDAIVNAIHGGNYKLYDKKLKTLYKNIENQIITAAASHNYNVIIDRPNHSVSMRRRYIGLAKSFDMQVHVILFGRSEPITHAYRRYREDSRGHTLEYWHQVAKSHEDKYQTPDMEKEGFDRLFFYNYEDNATYEIAKPAVEETCIRLSI
jgi:predicted kinase